MRMAPDHLARARIRHLDAVDLLTIFVAVRDLEARPVWNDIGDIEDVGVPEAVGPQRLAVVVDHHRPERDFFASIAVDVEDVHPVRALTTNRRSRVIAEPAPCLDELAADQIPRIDVHERVRAARGENAQPLPSSFAAPI